MNWKQPIPTNLEAEFGDDIQAFVLFIMLLLKTANSGRVIKVGRKLVSLEKGQAVFGRKSFAKYIGASEHTVERTLKRLQDLHQKVSIKPSRNFTLVTVLNYDNLTSLEQEVSKKRASSEQVVSTYKNDKSVKIVKNEDINIYVGRFNELFEREFRPTSERQKKLRARLKTYKIEEVLLALQNLSQSPWHRGVNNSGWMADPDFLIRSDEQVDKWLNKNMEEVKQLSQISRRSNDNKRGIDATKL